MVILALVATSAGAQDLDYDPMILINCMENAESEADRTYCIGQAADACTMTEAGSSTVGLGYCYSEEWRQWDTRLNAAYQRIYSMGRGHGRWSGVCVLHVAANRASGAVS